ncbi:MAG: C69 family dipeptidase [Candidatus Aminicenantales bacterium]
MGPTSRLLKKLRFAIIIFLFLVNLGRISIPAQSPDIPRNFEVEEEGCTSIMAGRLATVDGSVITAHTCDGNYRMWLNIVPAAKHYPGTNTKIYSGKMHGETSRDLSGIVEKGEIPQVEETYAFLNTAYPCMNEHQLAIGETTIRGKSVLFNSEGMFLIEELARIMLERCRTAREAIQLAGQLVKEYGYGDKGECLTVADPKEVWHFEIFGTGLREKGAIWAAVRIPDDHVGISANIPRISELKMDDPKNCMASDNVISFAVEKGWYDPKSGEPFKFWKVYSGQKPFSIREFYVLSTLAPSLKLDMNVDELPFSVKPEKKVSVRDIMKFYRETYGGTAYDMTKNLKVKERRGDRIIKSPVANPWMSRDLMDLLNTLKPGAVEYYRPIAIAGCAYSQIIQCRDWLPDPVGGICWFAFDNPGQSARIPIFAGVTQFPSSFEICAQHRFRTDSAAWAFRRANRLATVRWGEAGKYIEEAIKEFEERAFCELSSIEKMAVEVYNGGKTEEDAVQLKEYLTKYTGDFARAAIHKYWEMGDKFWALFARGF